MTATQHYDTGEKQRAHDVRRVRMLFRMIPRSIVITVIICAVTAAVIADSTDRLVLFAWLAAAVLVSLGRLALYYAYQRHAGGETDPLDWENVAAASAGLMGITWGALALIGPLPPVLRVFVVFVLGGISLGSAGILGASVRAFVCFNAPMLLAQTGVLFYLGGTMYSAMGAMAVVFAAGLIISFLEFRSALIASIDAQTEIEMVNREQRLIFESVTAGVAFIRDRKIVDHNPQFARMLGYGPDELRGLPTRVYYTTEAKWQEVGALGYAALVRGEVYHQEYDFRTKSGIAITCDATMQSIVPGKPEYGVVAILNDITSIKEREFALRTALLEQLAVFRNAPAGIIRTRQRIVEDCNDSMAEMLGAPIEEIVGQTAEHWFVSRERWQLRGGEIYAAFAKGESYAYTEEFVRKDGSRFWCRLRGGAIDPDDPINGPAVFVLVDITDQFLAEAALRESREQMALVIRAAQSGLWDYNMATRGIIFSERFYEILGFPPTTPADALMPIMDRVHPEDQKAVKAAFYGHNSRHAPINEPFRLRHADGRYIWVRGQGQAKWDESGKVTRFVGSITDITEQRRQEEEIRRLALEDPLTSLPNRRLLEDRLERALSTAARNSEQVAVLLLDLDGFKDVNDEYGHAAGDAVLKAIAMRLKENVRDSDTVARTGGDEFVLLVRAIQEAGDAARLAEKLLAAIHEPICDGEATMRVGASIGIAMYPADTLHPAQLLRMADKAMYEVKQSGRNGFRLATGLTEPN